MNNVMWETPCFVVACTGSALSVSYEDGWCNGPSQHLGKAADDAAARELVKRHIRKDWDSLNGLPLYVVSDHGNVERRRGVRLRSRRDGWQ